MLGSGQTMDQLVAYIYYKIQVRFICETQILAGSSPTRASEKCSLVDECKLRKMVAVTKNPPELTT